MSELVFECVVAGILLLFFLFLYISVKFGSSSIKQPAKPQPAIIVHNNKPQAPASVTLRKELTDEERMSGFLQNLDKSLYDNILHSDLGRIESVYKSNQRTSRWEEHFFRSLDDRKFEEEKFFDTKYVSFNYGLWKVTVLFHNKKAVNCAVIGASWHCKPFLDKHLPSKKWFDAGSKINWSFVHSEGQFHLYARLVE